MAKVIDNSDALLKLDTSDKSVKDTFDWANPNVDGWGHRLELMNNDGNIQCIECGKTEKVPDMNDLRGFQEVVFRLHALGKFKGKSCGGMAENRKI